MIEAKVVLSVLMEKKKKRIAIAVLMLIVLIIIMTGPYVKPLFSPNSPNEVKRAVIIVAAATIMASLFLAFRILPYFFKTKNILAFMLCLIGTVGLLYLIHVLVIPNTDHLDLEHFNLPPGVFSFAATPPFPFPIVFVIIALPSSFSLYDLWVSALRQKEQAETEQLKTELNFLKSQISPHFLFNSLNSIYSLTQSDPQKSGEVTLKLSKLLRFLVYDTLKEKTISIEEELDFMQNYISLSRLRLTSKTKVEFQHEIEDPTFQIPPLLLLIFVENCFKHGVTTQYENTISISLKQKDGQLLFETKNPYIPKKSKQAAEDGNVGLVNVKRRLDLNYSKNAYDLEYGRDNLQYVVKLKLNQL